MKFNFGVLAILTYLVNFANCKLSQGDTISDSSGWFVVIGGVAWEGITASTWKFPKPNTGDASWFVNQMTNAILGAGEQHSWDNKDAGGGWEVWGVVVNFDYNFGEIPRTLMTTILTRMLSDSNTNTYNGVDIVIADSHYNTICQFGIRPTVK
jgi:hypothetical protein